MRLSVCVSIVHQEEPEIICHVHFARSVCTRSLHSWPSSSIMVAPTQWLSYVTGAINLTLSCCRRYRLATFAVLRHTYKGKLDWLIGWFIDSYVISEWRNCCAVLQRCVRWKYPWSSVLILLASCQQTCMTYAIAVCAVKNSWWWTEELSETCRVLFQKWIWENSASSWFYYKNISRCTVTWTSNSNIIIFISYLYWITQHDGPNQKFCLGNHSVLDTCSFFFFLALRPNAGHGLLILEVSRSQTTTHRSR